MRQSSVPDEGVKILVNFYISKMDRIGMRKEVESVARRECKQDGRSAREEGGRGRWEEGERGG